MCQQMDPTRRVRTVDFLRWTHWDKVGRFKYLNHISFLNGIRRVFLRFSILSTPYLPLELSCPVVCRNIMPYLQCHRCSAVCIQPNYRSILASFSTAKPDSYTAISFLGPNYSTKFYCVTFPSKWTHITSSLIPNGNNCDLH